MKPTGLKPHTVFRIIDKATGEARGSYSRACHDEFDFRSVSAARTANCGGEFENKLKYQIAKYRVTYTLIKGDCDNAANVKPTRRQIRLRNLMAKLMHS